MENVMSKHGNMQVLKKKIIKKKRMEKSDNGFCLQSEVSGSTIYSYFVEVYFKEIITLFYQLPERIFVKKICFSRKEQHQTCKFSIRIFFLEYLNLAWHIAVSRRVEVR